MYIIEQKTLTLNATESLVGIIVHTACPDNPMQEWSMLGTLAVHPSHAHWANEAIDLDIPTGNDPITHMENFIKDKGYKLDGVIAYPVTKFEHGGISLSLGDNRSCPFDSCIAGFIYAEKEKIRKEFGVKRITAAIEEKVAQSFENELEVLTQYLNGEVYGFRIYQVNTAEFEKYGEHCLEQSECIDRCCGYYDKKQVIAEMLDIMNYTKERAA